MHNISPEILTLLGVYPGTTGRVMLYVENGVITSSLPIPEHHFCCSVESFIELAQRAGWHVTPNHDEVTKSHATAEEVAHVA
ncbi:TPA: hypothetical protein ACXIJH_004219 [Serratia marcescens]